MVALNPVAGDQEYVFAPLAVRLVLLPVQMEGAAGVTVIVAFPFTVTQTATEVTLPQLLVTTAWKQVLADTGPYT